MNEEWLLPAWKYQRRCEDVYWHGAGAAACGDRGPNNATCLLLPGHPGDWHEGNGFDVYGPMHRSWLTKDRTK